MKTHYLIARPSLALAAWLAAASLLPNPAAASSATRYPLLPDLPGADIEGETQIVIHFIYDAYQGYIPLVQVGEQLLALGGRPLELATSDLDLITVLFVAPRDSTVFVFEDGILTQELDPLSGSKFRAFDMVGPSSSGAEEYDVMVAPIGQPAPTVPDLVIRPTDPDPT
jgi:hypothetical protein